MSLTYIRNKLYEYPHRCNDADVEYLIGLVDHLQEEYKELQDQYHKTLAEGREHSNAMFGDILGLVLNKPKLFYQEKRES